MKRALPPQLIVALIILGGGGSLLGGEYFLVKWYPHHRQRVVEEALAPVPYRNDGLGIEMKVAAGLYGKVESFPGGTKIYKPLLWSVGPSLTITSQANPDGATEFSPQVLAKWETDGTTQEIPRYDFEHTKVMDRDAVFIRQLKNRSMLLTLRVISPDRIVEADCTPGQAEEALYIEACDESLRTMKVEGPESPAPPAKNVNEIGGSKKATR